MKSNFSAILHLEEQSCFTFHFYTNQDRRTRLVALAQKFDVVSKSPQFLFEFPVLSRDMAHNACRQTYVLDSILF